MRRHEYSVSPLLPLACLSCLLAAPAICRSQTVFERVERLTKVIRKGEGPESVEARAEIRRTMELYFRDQQVPLRSYPLPFKQGRWKITQGNSTVYSHSRLNQFCWDFELVDRSGFRHPLGLDATLRPQENYSYGAPIHAVAPGRTWTRTGGTDGTDPSNIIVIHHDDGTRAIYDHIRPGGCQVKTGQRVESGQLIGHVGYTGTSYPHIHFSVRTAAVDDWTLPVRFDEYHRFDPNTNAITKVLDGVPLEGQIIAATVDEARDPSSPKRKKLKIPDGAETFGDNRYYYFFSHKLDWASAQEVCARHAAHLVTITSRAEDTFVARLIPELGNYDRVWIGLSDAANHGQWLWITGEPLKYTNWAKRQPDNLRGNQHHAQIGFAGTKQWSDGDGTGKHPFVCEWEASARDQEYQE